MPSSRSSGPDRSSNTSSKSRSRGSGSRRKHAGPPAKALVDSLTGSSALPALIEQMSPATLKRLVTDVGIEDAGALIVHASETQLKHLLDETIWTGARPGDPESLSVENLLRWLAVWTDAGVCAEKLFELGEDFCALGYSRLLVVADTDLSARVEDEFTQILGEYIVRARQDDEWDVIQASLNELWSEYPDFTEAVFGRLAFRHSILGIEGENDSARVLDADASHARERRRETEGFVTSVMAGAWLRRVAEGELDDLAAEATYDLDTTEYFRRREAEAQAAEAASAAEEQSEQAPRSQRRRDERTDESTDEEAELDELEAELAAYEAERAGVRGLLAGPGGTRERLPLREALSGLNSRPELLEARQQELAYLANLLVAGASRDDGRIEDGLAANIAMACANLGGSYLLWLEFGDSGDAGGFEPFVTTTPGLVRLFRIGWQLLARVPLQVAGRLERLLDDPGVRERLTHKPMVLTEVDALLAPGELTDPVRERRFADARETLQLLTILLEPLAVDALCALVDDVPALPLALDPERRSAPESLLGRTREVASMDDLMQIDGFLKALAEQLRR